MSYDASGNQEPDYTSAQWQHIGLLLLLSVALLALIAIGVFAWWLLHTAK